MLSIKNIIKRNNGETLIEVIASVAILAILMATLLSILLSSLNISNTAYKITKEDYSITTAFDVTAVSDITTSSIAEGSPDYTELEIKFIDETTGNLLAEIKSDGTYLIGSKEDGNNLPLKQFVPN